MCRAPTTCSALTCCTGVSYASAWQVTRDNPEIWKAVNGGIGLIGVITEIKIQLTPPTNTQLKTILNQPDDNMYEMIEKLLQVGSTKGWAANGKSWGGCRRGGWADVRAVP
jgi:hypothetical protein